MWHTIHLRHAVRKAGSIIPCMRIVAKCGTELPSASHLPTGYFQLPVPVASVVSFARETEIQCVTTPPRSCHPCRQHFGRRMLFQQQAQCVERQRFAEVISLDLVAVVLPQVCQLLRCFDTFGNHFQAQAVCERNNRRHNRGIVRIIRDVADE